MALILKNQIPYELKSTAATQLTVKPTTFLLD